MSPDVILAVEELGKRNTDVHELRYMPAVSVVARLRSRRDELPTGLGSVYEDDDEEDDEEEEEDDELERLETTGEWAVRDVDFTVAPGEALGLVGDRASVMSLLRILVGMTAPTEGHFTYRGRAGMSSEMALTLARREMIDTRIALRTLAALAGVPRRRRKAWMRDVKSLVAGMAGPKGRPSSKSFNVNLAISASLDPTADLLFVDRLPRHGDDDLLERCTDRIRRRLAEGAAVIVATPDTRIVEELCGRVVQLEAGRIARVGPAAEILPGLRESQRRGTISAVKPFNSDAAIMSAALVDSADRPARELKDGGPFRALVHFEIVTPDSEVTWRVRLRGTRPSSFAEPHWRSIGAPGAFIVTLELPVAEWEDDEYEISVDAIVRQDGRTSTVRRSLGDRFPVIEAGEEDRGEGIFDATKLRVEWAPIDEPA